MISEEFDNGSLMLETELDSLTERYQLLSELMKMKREECNSQKCLFPRQYLAIAEEQMEQLQHNIEIASIAVADEDRTTATTSLQVGAELVSSIEGVLNGEGVEWESEEDE